jgi:hypothetical protein
MCRIVSTIGALGVLALVATSAQAQIGATNLVTDQPTTAPVQYLTPSIDRIGIDAFPRNDTAALPVSTIPGGPVPCFWNNGTLDNVTAHLAMKNAAGEAFLAADDFYVKPGDYYFIHDIVVCFAVPTYYDGLMFKPQFELAIHADCSGRPDSAVGPIVVMVPNQAVNAGPSVFAGFNTWQVTFALPDNSPYLTFPFGHYWLCPYGIGEFQNGFYYWLSAGGGNINGAQAQIKNGAEPWMDVQTCDCPGICTDLYFQLCGHVCCILKLNQPYDPNGGAKSLQLKGATIDTARAVDNFQVPPGPPRGLCALQAYFATNCPLDKIFLEIYDNVCNMPGTKLATIDLDGYPLFAPTGLTYNGVPVYLLSWPDLAGYLLPGGHDYWLSIVARGTGSILDKAYWMYLAPGACNINITEGKVKDPYVAGLEDFTFVSVATGGPPRDFNFVLWTDAGTTVLGQGDGGTTSPPATGGNDSGQTTIDRRTFAAPLPR